ncbi:stabilizer of axonemal microtubules 2 [Thomomys bottae]
MRTRCLCQICTCGRHHCPQGATRIYDCADVSYPTTEYVEKYPTHGSVLPPPSLKPKQQFQGYRGKMEGVTIFKSDYRRHDVVQPPRRIPEGYKPKQGKMDFGTTYKQDFNYYKVQPAAAVQPLEKQPKKVKLDTVLKKGKLDTVPTYKDDYRHWDLQKQELCKPDHTYHPPTEKFGNATTFQDDFVHHPMEARRKWAHGSPVKPSSFSKPLGPGFFQGFTSYSLDFTPKHPEACPASDLCPQGYKFETTDSRGHRFFRKVTG